MTSINQQTPGPLVAIDTLLVASVPTDHGTTCAVVAEGVRNDRAWRYACDPASFENIANARLLAAGYTAFDKAGRQLGIDAAELAESIDLVAAFHALELIRSLARMIKDGDVIDGVEYSADGNADTGEDWLDDFEVVGRIGRSMGPMRVPLLIEDGECGGGSLITNSVLRIQRLSDGKDLYRHPAYKTPEIELCSSKEKGYVADAVWDGRTEASFKTWEEAERWRAFMIGASPWR